MPLGNMTRLVLEQVRHLAQPKPPLSPPKKISHPLGNHFFHPGPLVVPKHVIPPGNEPPQLSTP
eukprot:360995-Chlamydomonas_euryale.AAC.4